MEFWFQMNYSETSELDKTQHVTTTAIFSGPNGQNKVSLFMKIEKLLELDEKFIEFKVANVIDFFFYLTKLP